MHKVKRPTSAMSTFELHIIYMIFFIFGVSSFNLEQRLPVVKVGPQNSLFGLSVNQHHISAGNTEANNAVILVGAPKAEKAPEHSSDSVKPGGLFKCDVSLDKECSRVIISQSVNTLRANSSNQWLGVTVKSQRPGGKIVVCAHRYTIRGGARDKISWEAAIGRCFLLENTVEPVKDQLSFEWVPCLGKQDPAGAYTHEWFGYCQAGTGVGFVDAPNGRGDDEEFLIFGAPGSFAWSGALYTSQVRQELFSVNFWSREEPGRNNLIKKNSLLGSSIAAGVLLNYTTKDVNYVTGAPGSNVTGSVVIFEKRGNAFDQRLEMMEVINGDKIASRFGHEIQLIDITGDGRLDLIVGAPQYYDRKLGLGGAVYIYVNKGIGQMGPEPTQILFGKVDSSFGMSISSVGDMNMDGAEDIAIGAPGEDEWKGAVYIYHGDNQKGTIGVHVEPSQVIRAKELEDMGYANLNITGMGYSVSGGLDMDFNGYPDISMGSLSDSVLLFLSRPIVDIFGTITGPDRKIILGDRLDEDGYDVTVCLKYTSKPFNKEVKAICTIKLDADRLDTELLPRASFSRDDQSVYEKTLSLTLYPQSRNKDKCETLKVYINKDVQDKLTPIKLILSFTTPDTMPKRKRRAVGVPVPMPIMNAAITDFSTTVIEFSKDCGDDEICNSKLSMSAYYEVLKGELWETIAENDDGIPVLKLGTEKQIGMMITVVNPDPGEDAHQAQLRIQLPDVLEYRSIDKIQSVSDLHCDPDEVNRTLVICSLGNPFMTDMTAQFRVKLSKNKTAIYKSSGFKTQLQLLTKSVQKGHDVIHEYPVIVHVEAQLRIVGYGSTDQVKFGGKVIGESAVRETSDAGEILSHTYEVENTGTGPADNVKLHIRWPQTIRNGKWLFYLLKVDISGGKGNCTLPPAVNPLSLQYLPNSRRRKRAAEPVADAIEDSPITKKAPKSSYEELICPESASCVEFTCDLGRMPSASKHFIKLYAILWNSTFLEEYEGVSQIKVASSAWVSIAQPNIKFSELSKLNDTVFMDVLSETVIVPKAEVKWWIIAVATLAGVILLVCIILLFWKCGFFKRRKFGDYQKARRHKQASKKADERENLY